MNDDELSERAEAASAYLDGELDVAERASAAADPDTMALVQSFARVRDSLSNVDAVSEEVRTSAISAALAQFDVTERAAAAMPAYVPAAVTSLHTRRLRAYRVLARVAAAVVIVGLGVAALKASNGGEDAKTSSGTEPLAAGAPRSSSPVLKSSSDAAPAGTAAAAGAAPEGAAMVPAVNNAQDLARYASSFARDGAAPTAATPPAAASAPAASTPYIAASATTPGPVPAAPKAGCLAASDVVLGPISVLGIPALAVRDTSTGVVRAIAASDCRVLFTTP